MADDVLLSVGGFFWLTLMREHDDDGSFLNHQFYPC